MSIFLGVGLAASVGFRVFLPLFALSLAAYNGIWDLNANWEWIGSLSAVITLGVATLVELFAYFIPWVDNLLDSIAIPLAALAGTAVMVSTVAGLDPVVTWSLAIIAGGGPFYGGGHHRDRNGNGHEPGIFAGAGSGSDFSDRRAGVCVSVLQKTAAEALGGTASK